MSNIPCCFPMLGNTKLHVITFQYHVAQSLTLSHPADVSNILDLAFAIFRWTLSFSASFSVICCFVSLIFHQISIFSSNDSPSKAIRNVFYSIEKALFILKMFKFL